MLIVDTSSGVKTINTVSANSIHLTFQSGWNDLAQVVCNDITVKSDSGNVEFSELNAQNIIIDLSLGHVNGSIIGKQSDFVVTTRSNSGKNNLPIKWGQGSKTLSISTSSGDIDVTFTE